MADSLSALLKETFDCDVSLVAGDGGVFDVERGGELIYSKFQTGSFPDEKKLVDKIRETSRLN